MSYKALYRKWRPTVFDDVVGQAHITNTLKNEIRENKIAHAYLFTGTRGTGKTSTAKIFSRAVNCENPHNGNPCNECKTCKSILNDTVLDIIEIDAASNTGVDNIRSVIEQVQYAPTVGKYKVYIIDEVHMLSGGAFNALLKTLEEPPEYVVFILATTETHKVPATILSRCQRFDFKTITVSDISERINFILKKEGLSVSNDAVRYISYLGQGSMRDSLSILEQCLAFGNENLSYDDVVDILGSIDDRILYKIAEYISRGDCKSVVETFETLVSEGRNLDNFAPCLLDVFRQLIVSKVTDGKIASGYSEEKNELIRTISEDFSRENLLNCINLISELIADLKFNSMQRVLIETALIRMANGSNDSITSRIEKLEQAIKSGIKAIGHASDNSNKNMDKHIINEHINEKSVTEKINTEKTDSAQKNNSARKTSATDNVITHSANNDVLDKIVKNWREVVEKVFTSGGLTLYSAVYSSKVSKNGDTLILECDDYNKKQILISSKKDIVKYIKEIFDEDVSISIYENDEKLDKKDDGLFGNLSDLSNKFPNNINVEK